ncbi:hypothetical protein LMG24235_08564 [Paraburkholderia sabiae]|nr:hypothetical protein LMG24235_08564 [Paraburkholderia sabiae]
MALEFVRERSNVVLIGPNGVGKSTLALNLAYRSLIHGYAALFTTAGQMLGELAALDSDSALRRRLHRYASPEVLLIDEVGYLSYSNRHADLLFELVSRRYGAASTVVTTNKPFAAWPEVFPNAPCVVSLVDRLVHRASRASRIASRKRASGPSSAPGGVTLRARRRSREPPHAPVFGPVSRAALPDRRGLVAPAGVRRVRAAQRSARAHLDALRRRVTRADLRAAFNAHRCRHRRHRGRILILLYSPRGRSRLRGMVECLAQPCAAVWCRIYAAANTRRSLGARPGKTTRQSRGNCLSR